MSRESSLKRDRGTRSKISSSRREAKYQFEEIGGLTKV